MCCFARQDTEEATQILNRQFITLAWCLSRIHLDQWSGWFKRHCQHNDSDCK